MQVCLTLPNKKTNPDLVRRYFIRKDYCKGEGGRTTARGKEEYCEKEQAVATRSVDVSGARQRGAFF